MRVITMDKIDIKVALSVFDKVISRGERKDETFFLNGLYATPSFDGYTVSLTDQKVTLSILFHNKFNLVYDSKKSLSEFLLKLERIDRDH